MKFQKRIALVTGSSKGIGQGIAKRLAVDGMVVYVTYHTDKTGGEATVKSIEVRGGQARLLEMNVAEETSVLTAMKTIEKEEGHLDVLVNNAERDVVKTMEEATLPEWKMAFETKLHGAWLSTKYALPLLRKSDNANVIFVSSSADVSPNPEILSYAVATGALNSMIRALAIHLPKSGIRVNAVITNG